MNPRLTKENGQEVILIQQFVQHLSIHILDFILYFKYVLRGQPGENLIRLIQISIVEQGDLFPIGSMGERIKKSFGRTRNSYLK